MSDSTINIRDDNKKRLMRVGLLAIVGVALNMGGSFLSGVLGLPIYLDSIGTVLCAVWSGYLPGIAVGFVTNFIKSFTDDTAIYYGTLNVLIAVVAAFLAKRDYFKKIYRLPVAALGLAVIGGGLGSLLTWFLYGFAQEGVSTGLAVYFHYVVGLGRFPAQFSADFLLDVVDKLITVLIVFLLERFVPRDFSKGFRFAGWQQKPLTDEERESVGRGGVRTISLGTKIIIMLLVAGMALGLAAVLISYYIFKGTNEQSYARLGTGVAAMVASAIDPEMVDEYLEKGSEADGYTDVVKTLSDIQENVPEVEYIYAYKFDEEGCHTVFDLDLLDNENMGAGYVESYDESFDNLKSDLIAGKSIEPIITNDKFGYLLTAYIPVYNDAGECVCYGCADIQMKELRAEEYRFFARLLALFLGFFTMILACGLWLAKYNIVLPVNTMADAVLDFAQDSEERRRASMKRIHELSISTGDEVENLYHAFEKMGEESIRYVDDISGKAEQIRKMQNGLILVLADMVESRDLCTGQHIRKTAAYTRVIMDQMRREGMYPDILTDEFMDDVVNSAPLHDIGKIKVPDAVLNKPGRLTDEEFDIMKTHTTEGGEILTRAIEMVPGSDYLNEARRLASCHHERWDGKGYPAGIAGDEIPLSARIMAVADVFDALVSKRSYKEGFPLEKAFKIIEEGAGTQFDPDVAKAFLDAREEAAEIAENFNARAFEEEMYGL